MCEPENVYIVVFHYYLFIYFSRITGLDDRNHHAFSPHQLCQPKSPTSSVLCLHDLFISIQMQYDISSRVFLFCMSRGEKHKTQYSDEGVHMSCLYNINFIF